MISYNTYSSSSSSEGNAESETKPLIGVPSTVTLQDPTSLNSSPIIGQAFPSGYPEYRYVRSDESGIDGTIVLMLTISFLSSISFSLALPALWQYVVHLGGGLVSLGWTIALHSAGTVLLSPVLVAWSRRRSMREVLIGSLLVMAIGGVLHGMSQNIYMLLLARFIIGAGSSNYVLTTVSSYLAQVSRSTRDRALYFNGIVTIVGFALGPGITACFTPLNLTWNVFVLNSLTAPGYFITFLALGAALFTMCASLRVLRKRARRKLPRPESYDPASDQPVYNNSAGSYDIAGSLLNYGVASSGYFYTDTSSVNEVPAMLRDLWINRSKLPLIQLVVCLFVYFAITVAFTIWETLGAYLTETQLGWSVMDSGLMFTGMGLVAGITILLLKFLTKMFAGRLILPCATFFMILGAIVLCAMRPTHWTIAPFVGGVALIALGYTGSVGMVIHVYACVLELSSEVPPPPSAVGWLSTWGSVARVVGPVGAAYLRAHTDDVRALMACAVAIPFAAALCVVISYRRLPP